MIKKWFNLFWIKLYSRYKIRSFYVLVSKFQSIMILFYTKCIMTFWCIDTPILKPVKVRILYFILQIKKAACSYQVYQAININIKLIKLSKLMWLKIRYFIRKLKDWKRRFFHAKNKHSLSLCQVKVKKSIFWIFYLKNIRQS